MVPAPTKSAWLTAFACMLIAALAWLARDLLEVALVGLAAAQIASFVAILLLVVGAIERSVEVLLNGLVDPAKSERDAKVRRAQKRVENANAVLNAELEREVGGSAVTQYRSALEQEAKALRIAVDDASDPDRSTKNTTGARVLALAFSFAAAVVGFRVLGQLLHATGSPLGNELGNCDTLAQVADVAKEAAQEIRDAIENLPPPPQQADGTPPGLNVTVRDLDSAARSLTEGAGELTRAQSTVCKNVYAQVAWLRMVDVILTTLVLSGGAEGVHRIVKRART